MDTKIRTLGIRVQPTKESIETLFKNCFNELPEKLWPEYISASGDDVGEPIPPGDPSPIIRYWEDHSTIPFVGRSSEPSYLLYFGFEFQEDTKPEPTQLEMKLHENPASDFAEAVFEFLIRATCAQFGSLSSEEDYQNRHWFSVEIPEEYSIVETKRGLSLDETIPGVYFKTFFSSEIVEEYDLELDDIRPIAYEVREFSHGYFVTSYEDDELLSRGEARNIERRIETGMNDGAFFHPEEVSEEQLRKETRIT